MNNNKFNCESVSFETLAQTYSTPLYVYSEQQLQNAYSHYTHAFKELNPLICYAVKANSNLSIINYFANLGAGFDIVSAGELARVLAAGGLASKTIFSGVGKTENEIKYALENQIFCFNVESIPELDRINGIAQSLNVKAPISLRINPDVDAHTHPYISTGLKANKFGIAYKDALKAYQYAAKLPYLNIIGIDCHIGSQLSNVSPLIDAMERLLILVDGLEEMGIKLSHIDLGGGIGIVYDHEETPDLNTYAQSIKKHLANRNLNLVLEPGRSLVGNAGFLLTKVEFIKKGEEKNFIIVDAAMNDLMRPVLYQAYHQVENATEATSPTIKADIVGPICESGDFLAKDRIINAKQNDLLVFHSTGAYTAAMASNYNTRARAAEVLVSKDSHRLIRQRESIEQLMQNEINYLSPQ